MEQNKKEKIIRKYLEDCYGEFVDDYDTTDVTEHFTYGLEMVEKEIKQKLKDKYNHYNSKLREATKTKLDRKDRTEYIIKLEAKVEILKQLLNETI